MKVEVVAAATQKPAIICPFFGGEEILIIYTSHPPKAEISLFQTDWNLVLRWGFGELVVFFFQVSLVRCA